MKKKNLKNLNLRKSTISNLHAKTIAGGTDAITIVIVRTTDFATRTGCSKLMVCDSVAACPEGIPKTKFVDVDTRPASSCIHTDI
ncbi:hypothetical protein [uncultured Kordia sp.]|uniref:hypothetical protein n=1 Tax=uncultured Kordia sp. TaxID=507699 RepID=UPI002623A634|nr:hypothetical protein [uncultured Kordia sp.]